MSFGVFAGVGANIAWDNGEAMKINDMLQPTIGGERSPQHLGRHKVRMAGRIRASTSTSTWPRTYSSVEAQANFLNDYNSQKLAHNADWYFNFLAGVKYTFGGNSKKSTKMVAAPVVPASPRL